MLNEFLRSSVRCQKMQSKNFVFQDSCTVTNHVALFDHELLWCRSIFLIALFSYEIKSYNSTNIRVSLFVGRFIMKFSSWTCEQKTVTKQLFNKKYAHCIPKLFSILKKVNYVKMGCSKELSTTCIGPWKAANFQSDKIQNYLQNCTPAGAICMKALLLSRLERILLWDLDLLFL